MVLCIFFFYHIEGHSCYAYSLGVCNIKRRVLNCTDVEGFEEKPSKLKCRPWWKLTGTSQKSPAQLSSSEFTSMRKTPPWCIYMLEHPSTVAASSLGIEDLPTFVHRYVCNKQMFAGCLLEEDNLRKMNEMSNRVEKHMKL